MHYKKIKKILEDKGFDVEHEGNNWFISQYTPEGEDWGIYLNKLPDIVQYAEDYDPEEEFSMWMEAKQNGVRGVPGVADLWQDQLWKQKILKEVAEEIK